MRPLTTLERDRIDRLVGRGPNVLVRFVVDGCPWPKERPRFVAVGRRGRFAAITSPATRQAERDLAWAWRHEWRARPLERGPLTLAAWFYRPTRRRVDVDNLLKLVLDAGTAARVWADDSQVHQLLGGLDLDRVHPRTLVALARVEE